MCKTHVFQRFVPKLKEKKLTSKTLNRFFKEDKERIRTHHQGRVTATLKVRTSSGPRE